MNKLTITNADDTKMSVDLVRYFKYKNDCYLIYTLNEVDQKGYLKLYLVKIMEELGYPVVYNIRDDKEWAGMQNIVKKVLKEIKSKKRKQLFDLDYNNIEGIKVENSRFFKLDQKLVEVLNSDYNVTSNVDEESAQINQEAIQNDSDTLESIDETLSKQGAFDPIDNSTSLMEEKSDDSNNNEQIKSSTMEEETLISPSAENLNENIKSENNIQNEVNYKELYLAEKKEREAISETMNQLLQQLVAYKTKYGELEK